MSMPAIIGPIENYALKRVIAFAKFQEGFLKILNSAIKEQILDYYIYTFVTHYFSSLKSLRIFFTYRLAVLHMG